MPNTRSAYAKFGTVIRLRPRVRSVPIVIVPDFMGSRLNDGGTLSWNPTGFPMTVLTGVTPGDFACDFDRLQQVSAELAPDDGQKKNGYSAPADNIAVGHIRGYFSAVTPYYGPLMKALAQQPGQSEHAESRAKAVQHLPASYSTSVVLAQNRFLTRTS